MSADTHRTYEERGNTNPKYYIIRDYCKKYPNDPGDQDINEEDVARPTNHKWVEGRLEMEQRMKTVVSIPTYGTCSICWNSGPAYKQCIKCGVVEYQVVNFKDYILDSQKIAELLGNDHEVAKANRLQHWLRTEAMRFRDDLFKMMLGRKHKHIEDEQERKRTITKEYRDFTAFYSEIGMKTLM
jgi:hypothetical protein